MLWIIITYKKYRVFLYFQLFSETIHSRKVQDMLEKLDGHNGWLKRTRVKCNSSSLRSYIQKFLPVTANRWFGSRREKNQQCSIQPQDDSDFQCVRTIKLSLSEIFQKSNKAYTVLLVYIQNQKTRNRCREELQGHLMKWSPDISSTKTILLLC